MNRSKLSIYKLCTAVVLITTAILGLVSFLALFEKDERYFKSSPIIIALYITVALAVLLGISAAFLSKKIGKIKIAPRAPYMLSLIPTATAVAVLAISIIEITKGNSGTHAILIAITLLGVAFYHLADVIKIPPAIRLALGYVKILFCILIITKLHLEFKVELNSPLKLLTQFSAATAILSTLTDLRILLDRISTGYFILSKICFLTVSLLGAIGALTEVASHPQKYTLDLLIYPILFLAVAIPTAVGFFTVKEDPGSDSAPQEEKTE
jgi:hypothetical protein